MEFKFTELELPGLLLIEYQASADARGFLAETYREDAFAKVGIKGPFVQENHTRSIRGVLRGLHFQRKPKAHAKLVRCVRGEVFDVAVDLRKGSKTFGKWASARLSDADQLMLYLPIGFAHAFVVLSESADVVYRQTEYYSPDHDRGVLWNDPALGIDWPVASPIVSAKDAALPRLSDAENEF